MTGYSLSEERRPLFGVVFDGGLVGDCAGNSPWSLRLLGVCDIWVNDVWPRNAWTLISNFALQELVICGEKSPSYLRLETLIRTLT